uniref:DUF5079 family protein n=1 Tax=Steinernema glaseri TaxID=37863 RepID=A0A1I7YEB3_9BILA
MIFQYLRSLQGLITVSQVLVGVLCQLIIQFIWNSSGDIALMFFITVYPFETVVYFLLFGSTMVTLAVVIMESRGSSLAETFGKFKVVLYRLISFLMMLGAAALQTYYVTTSSNSSYYFPRFIIGMILLYVLSLSHAFLTVLEIMRR